jgi:hypothetical protein
MWLWYFLSYLAMCGHFILFSLLSPPSHVMRRHFNSVAREVRAMSIMGHLGTTACVLVQWELMSALTVLVVLPPPLMHAEGGTLPTAWQGE